MIRPNLPTGFRSRERATTLNATLDKNLSAYATAAAAAGMGMLMSALPVEAKIVYTPSHIAIPVNAGTIRLDLNNDGIPDFGFNNGYSSGGARRGEGYHAGSVTVSPAEKNNAIWEVTSHNVPCAAALPKGMQVGPKDPLMAKSLIMAASHGSYTNGGSAFGPWLKEHEAYIGVRFAIHGKTHYGWARIQWNGIGTTEYIAGYAYETIANKPILTGKTKGPDADDIGEAADTSSSLTGGLGDLARGASRFTSRPTQ
jgi:hypothetical protein